MDNRRPGPPRPPSPSSGTVLQGHFLTRAEASRFVHLDPAEVAAMPGLVRLDGLLGEVYPLFQFTRNGGFIDVLLWVIEHLAGTVQEQTLAAWLTASHPGLGNRSPLAWLLDGRRPAAVLEAARVGCPTAA